MPHLKSTRSTPVASYARRYARANKKTETAIVNQVVELTGYNRPYTTWLLRSYSRGILLPQANAPAVRVIAAGDPNPLLSAPQRLTGYSEA